MLTKKPAFPVRLALGFLSLILCVLLIGSVLAAELLMDLKILASSDSLKNILTKVAAASDAQESEPSAQSRNPYLVSLSDTWEIPDGFDPNDLPAGLDPSDIPADIASGDLGSIDLSDMDSITELLDSDNLAGVIESFVQEYLGEEVTVDAETAQKLLEESTVMDFISEKVDSFLEDCINGTATTTISTEELMGLLEENQTLIEETLEITIPEEKKTEIQQKFEQVVEESGINETIQSSVQTVREQKLDVPGVGEMTVAEVLALVKDVTQTRNIVGAVAACVVLMLLVLALCFYNLGAGLRRCGYALTVAGAPLAVVQYFVSGGKEPLASAFAGQPQLLSTLQAAIQPLEKLHYGVLGAGLVLIVVGIVLSLVLAPKD